MPSKCVYFTWWPESSVALKAWKCPFNHFKPIPGWNTKQNPSTSSTRQCQTTEAIVKQSIRIIICFLLSLSECTGCESCVWRALQPTVTSKCHGLVLETPLWFRCLCPSVTVNKQAKKYQFWKRFFLLWTTVHQSMKPTASQPHDDGTASTHFCSNEV